MSKKMNYGTWMAVVLAVATLTVGCGSDKKQAPETGRVKIDTVRSASATRSIELPGRVQAADDASLSFRVSGVVDKILVNEGQRVARGQLLARLDTTDYRTQLNAVEAEYSQIKAEAERVIALYADGGVSANDYDRAVYGLQQITAKLQYTRDQLQYTRLTAPYAGVVGKKLVDEHEAVAAGMAVVSMMSTGLPEVEVSLSAADYVERASFAAYHCTVGVYPGVIYSLSPVSLSQKANANQLYTLRLRFEDNGSPLPSPGMNTMVTIDCSRDDGGQLSVAATALLHDGGHTYTYVYNAATGLVARREVVATQLHSNGNATIVATDVRPGDLVVTSGVHTITDGQPVTPLPAQTASNVGGLL